MTSHPDVRRFCRGANVTVNRLSRLPRGRAKCLVWDGVGHESLQTGRSRRRAVESAGQISQGRRAAKQRTAAMWAGPGAVRWHEGVLCCFLLFVPVGRT